MNRFLFADSIHIHAKSFASLISHITTSKTPLTIHEPFRQIKTKLGDYSDCEEIAPFIERLSTLSNDELFDASFNYIEKPIRLFPLCMAECLAYCLATESHWHQEPIGHFNLDIKEKIIWIFTP